MPDQPELRLTTTFRLKNGCARDENQTAPRLVHALDRRRESPLLLK